MLARLRVEPCRDDVIGVERSGVCIGLEHVDAEPLVVCVLVDVERILLVLYPLAGVVVVREREAERL